MQWQVAFVACRTIQKSTLAGVLFCIVRHATNATCHCKQSRHPLLCSSRSQPQNHRGPAMTKHRAYGRSMYDHRHGKWHGYDCGCGASALHHCTKDSTCVCHYHPRNHATAHALRKAKECEKPYCGLSWQDADISPRAKRPAPAETCFLV